MTRLINLFVDTKGISLKAGDTEINNISTIYASLDVSKIHKKIEFRTMHDCPVRYFRLDPINAPAWEKIEFYRAWNYEVKQNPSNRIYPSYDVPLIGHCIEFKDGKEAYVITPIALIPAAVSRTNFELMLAEIEKYNLEKAVVDIEINFVLKESKASHRIKFGALEFKFNGWDDSQLARLSANQY